MPSLNRAVSSSGGVRALSALWRVSLEAVDGGAPRAGLAATSPFLLQHFMSAEVLKVYFNCDRGDFRHVLLEG